MQKQKKIRQQIEDKAKQELIAEQELKKRRTKLSLAEQELAERILAQRHLLPFIQRMKPDYKAGWVHEDICMRLENFVEQVIDEQSPRLMLFMPPRTGKSEIVSKHMPAWFKGNYPTKNIITASYNVPLSLHFSRKVQDVIRNPAYKTVFPVRMRPNFESAEEWQTVDAQGRPYESVYFATGVDSGATGKGAHIFNIDDPVKNRTDADSITIQQKTWDWYTSTAYTRLEPGGGIVLTQTRWAYGDLAGRLLDEMDKKTEYGDVWEVVMYPAIAEHDEYINEVTKEIIRGPTQVDTADLRLLRKRGQALDPRRYDKKALLRIRDTVGPRDWAALYQQTPIASDGGFFKESYFQKFWRTEDYAHLDKGRHILSGDLAIGEKRSNDLTVFSVGSIMHDGEILVRDMIYGRFSNYEKAEIILDLHKTYNFYIIGLEKGQIEMSLMEVLKRRQRELRLYPKYDETLKPIHDKEVRAGPLQGILQAGDIYFPINKPQWYHQLVGQCLRFGAGSVDDDFVDSLAWLIRLALKVAPPKVKGKRIAKLKTVQQLIKEHLLKQNKTTYMSS